jgi:hypothetical protein
MRRLATVLLAAWWVLVLGCAVRERRPDGPNREAEEFADAFSDEVVACARDHAPSGSGEVLVAAEFTGAGQVPRVHDAGSMPGSEPLIACARKAATEKLRCPKAAPARYVRIRAPIPLVTSEVKYSFTDEQHRP